MDFVRNLSSKLRNDPVWIGSAYQFQKIAYLCVEILESGSSLSDCCKENKYFICEKAKGELPQKKFI